MGKKITKTIIITILCIISACLFLWGALCIFSPYTLGKFSKSMGDDKTASAYFEVDYKRNKSDARLYNLTSSMFYAKKYAKTEKYGKQLLCRETFLEDYSQADYVNIATYVITAEYYNKNEELCKDLITYGIFYDGEKIVNFNNSSSIFSCVTKLAYNKKDKTVIGNIITTLEESVGTITNTSTKEKFLHLTDYTSYENLIKLLNDIKAELIK